MDLGVNNWRAVAANQTGTSLDKFLKKPEKKGIYHLSMSEIKIPTSQTEIIDVIIFPKTQK